MAETMTLREKAERLFKWAQRHAGDDAKPEVRAMIGDTYEVSQAYLESLPPADDEAAVEDATSRIHKLAASLRSTEDQLIKVADYFGAKCGDGIPPGSGDTLADAIIRKAQGWRPIESAPPQSGITTKQEGMG